MVSVGEGDKRPVNHAAAASPGREWGVVDVVVFAGIGIQSCCGRGREDDTEDQRQ